MFDGVDVNKAAGLSLGLVVTVACGINLAARLDFFPKLVNVGTDLFILMPMFQIETACVAVITNNAASLLSFDKPNAATIPKRIGTTAPARAVALGTTNANAIATKIAPKTSAFVFVPTNDKIHNAIRLCKFVICMAAAKNSAIPTNATAELLNPPKASFNALLVPISTDGSSILGAKPKSTAINAKIIAELTG